jgi:GMP synthase-like glutamine amidotransferase
MTPLMSYSAGRRMLAGLIVGVAATVAAPRRLYDPGTACGTCSEPSDRRCCAEPPAYARRVPKPVLIRQHVGSAPPGLLGEWLDAREIASEVDRTWIEPSVPDPERYAWIASLGHDRMAGDTHDPAVAAERELLVRAVERAVPVLGLCYGGQVLAAVLGAEVGPAPVAELGWRTIETDDPDLVPAGPWLEWHFERFCTPPAATELARTGDAPQAFRIGPHLGVQFHPEATVEIVAEWGRADGVEGYEELIAASPEQRAAARDAAFRLFDSFLARIDHMPQRFAI